MTRERERGMVVSRELLSGVPGRGVRGIGNEVMRRRRWMCALGCANCEEGDR